MISRLRRFLLGLVAVLVGVALIPSGSRTQEPPELGAIASHGLTLLPNARLLISGGIESGGEAAHATVVEPGFIMILPLAAPRVSHTATLLPDGRVLLAGGTHRTARSELLELVDASTNTVSELMVRLPVPLADAAASLLGDGRVLVTGGRVFERPMPTVQVIDVANDHAVELFDLTTRRAGHTSTLLTGGQVLIAGGTGDGGVLTSAETWDPVVLVSSALRGGLNDARTGHTATLLPSGDVLIVGGVNASGALGTVERFEPGPSTFSRETLRLRVARAHHSATLLPSGAVLIWGGVNAAGTLIDGGELLDPVAGTSTVVADLPSVLAADATAPWLAASEPANGTRDVPLDATIALRVSEPVRGETVTPDSVQLIGPSGVVAASTVPAEGGLLLVVTPAQPLARMTTYTVVANGVTDTAGLALLTTRVSFTTGRRATAGHGGGQGGSGGASEPPSPIPPDQDDERIARDPRTGLPISRWQSLPPLMAPPGVTAVSGQVLRLNGEPLANATLAIESVSTRTDDTGRFLLRDLRAGARVLVLDGRTATTADATYGVFDYGLRVVPRQTTVLPFTSWMPKIDTANVVRFSVPTQGEVVITTPRIPGFEVRIPAGTMVEDRDGRPLTYLSITPIPPDRPPFPLPEPFAMHFTIQPGGASFTQGARVTYPNVANGEPGKVWKFWNYEPEGAIGWYHYGEGTVGHDAKHVHPGPDARMYKVTMSGCCPGSGATRANGPAPGSPNAADPVNMSSGLFVLRKTDLVIPDLIPIVLDRTYRPDEPYVGTYGVGTNDTYGIALERVGASIFQWPEANVILPDGGRVHYVLIQSGIWPNDYVYEHRDTPTAYFKSRLKYNGPKLAWDMVLRDGTTYSFGDHTGVLMEIRDRYGNTLTITRGAFQIGDTAIKKITSPSGRFVEFAYASGGQVVEVTDNIGRAVKYEYDGSSRLVKVIDPGGGVKEYTYDAAGRMATIKDARGNVVLTNEYYTSGADNGRVKKQTLASPSFFTYQFTYTNDGQGRITQIDITDPRGVVREVTFNAAGYTLTDTFALGRPEQQIIRYERDSDPLRGSLVRAVIDGLDRRTEYDYDTPGNVTQVRRLVGTTDQVTSTFTWENCLFDSPSGFCRPLVITPSMATTDGVVTFSYTGLNQTTITDARNQGTTISYNSTGQPTQILTPQGAPPVQYGYAGPDLTSVTDRLGRITTWTYDAAGRLLTRVDPTSKPTTYLHNAVNRLIAVGDPAGGSTRFAYDPNGNLLSVKDAKGNTTTYTYDKMNLLETRTDALNKTESFVRDGNGNLKSHTDRKSQVTTFTYDWLNRRTSTEGYGYTTGYTWDAGDRLTQVVDSVGGTIDQAWDLLDRVTTHTTALGMVRYDNPNSSSDRGYDTLGRRLWMEIPGQTRITYAWDAANRLTRMQQGSQTVTFNYDDDDRRSLLTLPNGVSTEYQYDASSQVAALIYRNILSELGRLTYTYDQNGNRSRVGGSWATSLLPEAMSSATYDAGNRQLTFATKTLAYDDNGNLTQIADGGDITAYTWDSRNRLATLSAPGSTTAGFGYDALGRRSTKTVNGITTQFQYDGRDLAREITNSTAAGYLMGPDIDEPLVRNGSEFYLTDALGSTVRLTDPTAAITASYIYEPFGRTIADSAISGNVLQYAGRENDGTGLYYYRARYYSTQLHRFVSEDPIGFDGGDMTLYAYVGGAPTSRRDPLGLRWTGGDLAVSAPGVDCADSTPHGGMPGCGQSASDGAPLLSILFPGAVLTAPAPSVAAITVIGLGGAWLVYKMLEAISAPRTVSLSEAEQDKKLTDGEIDRLQSWDIDIHDLKGKVGASKRELFKDVQGNIKVKPRSGKGEGEPTGLNINDFPPRPRR